MVAALHARSISPETSSRIICAPHRPPKPKSASSPSAYFIEKINFVAPEVARLGTTDLHGRRWCIVDPYTEYSLGHTLRY